MQSFKKKHTREITAEELSFEWSHFSVSSKESKAGLKKSLSSILSSEQAPLTSIPRAIASVLVLVYPLSLNSDQHQFSPNNINTSLTEKIMKINKMITEGNLCQILSTNSLRKCMQISQENLCMDIGN